MKLRSHRSLKNAYFLTIMTYLGLTMTPNTSSAQPCTILVDKQLSNVAASPALFGGDKVTLLDRSAPESAFENNAVFKKSAQSQMTDVLPDSNTFLLTQHNQQTYLLFRFTRPTTGLGTVTAMKMPLPTTQDPLSCSTLKGWQNTMVIREQSLVGLTQNLENKPSELTVGESFIEAEGSAYLFQLGKINETEKLKRNYRLLLDQTREDIKQSKTADFKKQINIIKNNLKNSGLRNYCKGHISYADFINVGCTNCQGQTMLFTSLLLDLKVKAEAPWSLGVQIFLDHIRPVMYDGKTVEDLIYATTKADTGDPIYRLEFLEYMSLRQHQTLIPASILTKFEQDPKNLATLNPQEKSWYVKVKETLSTTTAPKFIDESNGQLTLFDFSAAGGKTIFNPNPAEFATLDLDGDIEHPAEERAPGNINAQRDSSGRYDQSYITCYGENANYSALLNKADRAILADARLNHYMSVRDKKFYHNVCPGDGFTNDVASSSDLVLYVPPEVFAAINPENTYDVKLQQLQHYYSTRYLQAIYRMIEIFDEPLSKTLDDLMSNQNFFFAAKVIQAHFDQHFGTFISSDPTIQAAMVQLSRSYLKLEDRIIEKPDEFINALNKIRYLPADYQNYLVTTIRYMLDQEYHAPEFNSRAFDMKYPLLRPITTILLTTHERLTLKPTSATQLAMLEAYFKKRGTSESTPKNIKINSEPIPLPISREEFDEYCETSKQKYYYNNSFAWPCEQAQDEVFIPKDKIITADAMKNIISTLNSHATANIITRLVAGLDSEFLNAIKNDDYWVLDIPDDARNMVFGANYLFDSQNPTLTPDCAIRDASYENVIKIPLECRKRVTFAKVNDNSQPPQWVKTKEDLVFWKAAVGNLTEELHKYSEVAPGTFDVDIRGVFQNENIDDLNRPNEVNQLPLAASLTVGLYSETVDYKNQTLYMLPTHEMIPIQGAHEEFAKLQQPKPQDINAVLFNTATKSLIEAIKYKKKYYLMPPNPSSQK